MKIFSGFIIAAIALTALPHLKAAPYLDTLLEHIATLPGNQDQSCPPYGISTVDCQDMLQLNPVLIDLQTYGSVARITVDCSTSSALCTDLTIHYSEKSFHSTVCTESGLSQGMKLYIIGKVFF